MVTKAEVKEMAEAFGMPEDKLWQLYLGFIESDKKQIDAEELKKQSIAECKEFLQYEPQVEVDEKLSIDQAAFLLGISASTLRNWEADGRVTAERTEGGHRRYSRQKINAMKKAQLKSPEFLIPTITPSKIIALVQSLFAGFDPDTPVNISLADYSKLNGKVVIQVESKDGLTSVSKSFSIKE